MRAAPNSRRVPFGRVVGVVAVGLAVGLWLAVPLPPARGAEPWANPALEVTAGLVLWLDADRAPPEFAPGPAETPSGAEGATAADLPTGQELAVWHDASGRQHAVRQGAAEARPRLERVGQAAVVVFDGVDDHLRLTGLAGELAGLTLYLVAAPQDNPGDFAGLWALNARDGRDYETGFNVDQGPQPSASWETLNVEGRGFGGAQDLLAERWPLGTLHRLEIVADPQAQSVRLAVDGRPSGERSWTAAPLAWEELTLGARHYTNDPGPQRVRGFFTGAIAEVLLYDRVLTADERTAVERYLAAKHQPLAAALPEHLAARFPASEERLVPVNDPPGVQVFFPGFEVRELPVTLTNVNNVRYRADGALVALAYDGNVYLLRDRDGDGCEETVTTFYENSGQLRGPIGCCLTPPGDPRGAGLFIASKGRVTLIADTDGDDRADRETIVASGWRELPVQVDAVGVALDPADGSLVFGLGTQDYSNPYVVDDQGQAGYRLEGERGTIQRVAADFSRRETVCTGVRFSIGLAFDRAGRLFATDQEGATWLANGNPFDELLWIQPGRHFGFPPRHPRHLPGVIDEPSVEDYGPQHQSTCGLAFNEPALGGRSAWGPAPWQGEALVAGYSRGKLYRTRLAFDDTGCLAETRLAATSQFLAADMAVSPRGDLVLATHSGGPDWGSGPAGAGRLFQLRYVGRELPQPVAAWSAGPREIRVAFDRPVPLDWARRLTRGEEGELMTGSAVRAGDRFETLRPGYAVVARQLRAPRRKLAIHSAQWTRDWRNLVLGIEPLTMAAPLALRLPGIPAMEASAAEPSAAGGGPAPLAQHPAIDLDLDLRGVAVTWEPSGPGAVWRGWWPHLDPRVVAQLIAGSADHDELAARLAEPGRLTLETHLDLTDMLRPAVQPGERLDEGLPPEQVTLELAGDRALEVSGPGVPLTGETPAADEHRVRFTLGPAGESSAASAASRRVPLVVRLATGGHAPRLTVAWHTAEDPRPRSLAVRRHRLPWEPAVDQAPSTSDADAGTASAATPPELAGGSWARGRRVFFDAQVGCAKCHRVGRLGGAVGPDLSNLVHRDYASVRRDVAEPSFAINPDYLTHVLELSDGRVLRGTLRTEGERLLVGSDQGQTLEIAASDVASMQAAPVSTMPDNLVAPLGPERFRDLLTFLLTPPPRMPRDLAEGRPAVRRRAEVEAWLARLAADSPGSSLVAATPQPGADGAPRPLRVILVAGPKDHGPGEHDYPAWQRAWSELLAAAPGVDVSTAWEWPAAEQWEATDAALFFQRGAFDAQRARDLDAFLARGGGAIFIHWAIEGGDQAAGLAERIGLASRSAQTRFRHGPLEVDFSPAGNGSAAEIVRGLERVAWVDESYWNLLGTLSPGENLGTAVEEGAARPQFWAREQGRGRVFVSIPGHYSWTFDDPLFRLVLLRALAWIGREPDLARFHDLAWPGAEVVD